MATRLYEILEVQATATAEEIRKAYKKRALKTHPDRLGPAVTPEEKKSAEEQFREVNQAYEILTDVEKRKEYDLHGQWPPPSAPRPSPSQGRRPHMQVYEEFDDPFSHPFFQNHNHEQFRSFAFTDPFTLFESIFGNAAGSRQSGGPTYTTSTSFTFNDPFTLNADRHTASDPFVSFPPFGGIFGALPGSMSTGGFGGQTFGAGSSNGQWASESFSTQTINGVTHTVHTRRDWEGNDHVTQMHGNGHETYTINGVEQTSQPQLQNQPMNSQPLPSARPNRQSSRDSAHFAPSQRQRASYQPQYDTQYSLPPQQSYSNQQPQYQTRNEPQIYVDYDSGFPSTSSEGKRRRDSHRSERPSHDTSRAHHHQHPASQHPNKIPRNSSRQASTTDRNPFRTGSFSRHHGGREDHANLRYQS